jgi:hypothetical protein
MPGSKRHLSPVSLSCLHRAWPVEAQLVHSSLRTMRRQGSLLAKQLLCHLPG